MIKYWCERFASRSWRGFQARAGGYGSVRSRRPSTGAVDVSFGYLVHDGPLHVPTDAQRAAFIFLMENEKSNGHVALRALYRYAQQRIANWPFDEDDEEGPAPKLAGMAYFGLEFGCVWDEEHCAGGLMHKKRIVRVGEASESFHGGEASADAKRMARKRPR